MKIPKTVTTLPTQPDIRWPVLVIFLFTIAIYSNTLFNDYALDDLMVCKGNSFTQKGLAGIRDIFAWDSFTGFWGKEKHLVAGGRYRPFSLAAFAIEKSLTGEFNPMLSHLINILLYALTGILVFIILKNLIRPPNGQPWYLGFPFLAAMLFIAHPVHTEVVANIKGRDEILALLFSLFTLQLTLLYLEKRKTGLLVLANLSFFCGLLSKENAIMFVIIVPLTIYFFKKVPLKKNLTLAIPLFITALIFVFIRFLVLGQIVSTEIPRELLNNPFLEATAGQKFGTILYTLGLYIKLLFFPHPLTHDYYPYHIPLVAFNDPRAIIPALLYAGLLAYAFYHFRSKSPVIYGILFYTLTLVIVSNLLFPVGTFMNERFIYMPSLGFVIVITYLIATKLPSLSKNGAMVRRTVLTVFIAAFLLCSVKTFTRNKVWKDDFTLFSTDVKVSENSIKCNTSAGGDYLKKATGETDSIQKLEDYKFSWIYLSKAVRLAPNSINALILYGNIQAMYHKDYKAAIGQYFKVLSLDPEDKTSYNNTIRVLANMDNQTEFRYKINTYLTLSHMPPANSEIFSNLGRLYGRYAANLDSAALCLETAIRISPKEINAYKDLGIIYSMMRDFPRAVEVFRIASSLDPSDAQVKQNLDLTIRIMHGEKK